MRGGDADSPGRPKPAAQGRAPRNHGCAKRPLNRASASYAVTIRVFDVFVDSRLAAFCAYCGGHSNSRDHVPAKTFLDSPYPENLPVVGSCGACNAGASLDEQYVSCLLAVATAVSVEPARLSGRAARTLARSPSLRSKMGLTLSDADVTVTVEVDRVSRVAEKIARALWRFEMGPGTESLAADVRFAPLATMSDDARDQFRRIRMPDLLPEVGSRAMLRILASGPPRNDWVTVQAGRFEYAVEAFGAAGRVKTVMSSYLATEVDLRPDDAAAPVFAGEFR